MPKSYADGAVQTPSYFSFFTISSLVAPGIVLLPVQAAYQ